VFRLFGISVLWGVGCAIAFAVFTNSSDASGPITFGFLMFLLVFAFEKIRVSRKQ
jgi:hypothetical protein